MKNEQGYQPESGEVKDEANISSVVEMLKLEARNSNRKWEEEPPVYVVSAGRDYDDAHTNKSQFIYEMGISSMETTDIACKRFESVEAALGYIREEAEKACQEGARVIIDRRGALTAKYPEKDI